MPEATPKKPTKKRGRKKAPKKAPKNWSKNPEIEPPESLQRALEEALHNGNTLRCACASACVPPNQYKRWAEAYPAFDDRMQAAMARAESRCVTVVQGAAQNGSWHAASWWLERRRPSEWGKREAPRPEQNKEFKLLLEPVGGAPKEVGATASVTSGSNGVGQVVVLPSEPKPVDN